MRTRRRTDDDEGRGILQDGEVRRVPLAMRDGGDWRGEMSRYLRRDPRDLDDRRRSRTVKRDPRGRVISQSETEEIEENDAMHDVPLRPGFTRDALDRIEQAYRDAEAADASAWKHLGSQGEVDVRGMTSDRWGGKVGAECTIDGAPGHLRMVRGELQCVPDAKDAMPELTGDAALDADLALAANIDNPVERAYAERAARDAHAWKRPL
jgi:hypothetical protein